MKRALGCFPIRSDIISDRKQAFLPILEIQNGRTVERTDRQKDGRTDFLVILRNNSFFSWLDEIHVPVAFKRSTVESRYTGSKSNGNPAIVDV